MNRAEIAVQTRNAVLAGNSVDIFIPDNDSLYLEPDDFEEEMQSWPQVLGAFAALYSVDQRSGITTPVRYDAPNEDEEPLDIFNGTEKLFNAIEINLTSSITKRSLREIVNFSGSGDLIALANDEAFAGLPTDVYSSDEASDRVTAKLTERGIRTLADKGIGAAVLLTERLAADERLSLTPEEIRDTVTQQGYRLLTPMMSSDENFRNLGSSLGRGYLSDPREFVRDVSEKRIGYDVIDGHVSNIHMKDLPMKKTGEFGCPFLHTKPSNALKPAWKIVVDTMWDNHLAPRIPSVNSPSK